MIIESEIHAVIPAFSLQKIHNYVPHLRAGAAKFQINTFLRECMYVAQILEESGGLKWMRELASGREYEGRRDLGNIYPGDGERFKGRGPFQLTGRANYVHYGAVLGLDLVAHPEWVETPQVGFMVAAAYWDQHHLNAYADQRDLVGCTRIINGGLNGLAERKRYYELCLNKFSRNDPASPIPEEIRNQPPAPLTDEFTDVFIRVHGDPVVLNSDLSLGFIQAGKVWVPLRSVCNHLQIQIQNVVHGAASISKSGSEPASVPCIILKDVGYSPIRQIAEYAGLKVNYNADNRTVNLI